MEGCDKIVFGEITWDPGWIRSEWRLEGTELWGSKWRGTRDPNELKIRGV